MNEWQPVKVTARYVVIVLLECWEWDLQTVSPEGFCVLYFHLDVEPNVCAASCHRLPACRPACLQAYGNCSKQCPLQEDPGAAKCFLCKLIDFIIAGLAYVQHSTSENCLQRVVFTAYAHRWQKAALRGTEIGVNFTLFFSKRNKHNNTVGKTRHEAFLNSNFYWDWIKNAQEIHQWKSLKLDQLSYVERSREHFGLPTVTSKSNFSLKINQPLSFMLHLIVFK